MLLLHDAVDDLLRCPHHVEGEGSLVGLCGSSVASWLSSSEAGM